MTDKVQKIRKEVVRLREQLQNKVEESDFISGEVFIINYFLTFIDSLQKEPVSIDFETILTEEWKGYNDRGAATVDALEDNTQELAFAKGFYRGWHYRKEEPVSEDLENAGKEWLRPQLDKYYEPYGEGKMMELTRFDGYAMLDAIEFGAKWQKQQDQSTIELAEDHAMLAGMEKMKEQMMEKAVETTFNVSLPSGLYDKLWIKGCKEGDKLLVIKK